MDVKEIAEALVAGVRERREDENLDRLYAEDAVSVEAQDNGTGREVRGRDGIRAKWAWWEQTFTVHHADLEGPFLSGDDRFAVIYEIDAEHKESGHREKMREVALYHVADGRIVREEFMY
jgi:ketosteroid isomerase-like protein